MFDRRTIVALAALAAVTALPHIAAAQDSSKDKSIVVARPASP